MLYLIGLGLNESGYSKEAYEAVKQCSKNGKIYLENYTVDFPYSIEELEKQFNEKIVSVEREFVESLKIVDEAKKQDVALLIYGSPLFATTHIALIEEAKKKKVKTKVVHSASVFDAVAETGLQLYKFGKIASVPKHEADSFIDVIKENQKIGAHTLLLVDIGLELRDSLDRLKKIKMDKIILCSRLGCKDSKIYYNTINNLKLKDVQKPYCFIIPGKLHFLEEEFLESF